MVEEKLGHFQYKWVRRGGDIFVRETTDAKAVKVVSEWVIDDLLAKHPACKTPAPKEPPKRDSIDPNLLHNGKSPNRYVSANRYANAVRNVHHDFSMHRMNMNVIPFNRPCFPKRPVTSAPIFTFREKSLVNYRSSAF